MKIASLGYGNVGAPLADHLHRLGHDVTLAARDAGSDGVRRALDRNADLRVQAPREAVGGADVVFLATPFQANEEVLKGVAPELAGKILVDCTNPVGPGLRHGLQSVERDRSPSRHRRHGRDGALRALGACGSVSDDGTVTRGVGPRRRNRGSS